VTKRRSNPPIHFTLLATPEAQANLKELEDSPDLAKRLKAVQKALRLLSENPRHRSLQTHKHTALSKKYGVEVFEAYAENHTPTAYRIFWKYGPADKQITIIAITPHP
jgi:hypothetical protein